jgi:hypothetical protein
MKKIIGLLIVSIFLMVPFYASADSLPMNVTLAATWNSGAPNADILIGSSRYTTEPLDFGATITNGGEYNGIYEAFCVDNHPATHAGTGYTLTAITTETLLKASWIADNYLDFKAAAQIAIWETVFDTGYDLNVKTLPAGFIAYTANNGSGYNILDKANEILDSLEVEDLDDYTTSWILASSPVISQTTAAVGPDHQDYIIKRVPEPTQMLLLGTALIGLAGIGRKKFFKK